MTISELEQALLTLLEEEGLLTGAWAGIKVEDLPLEARTSLRRVAYTIWGWKEYS